MKTFISRTPFLSASVQVFAQSASFTEPPSAPPSNNAYAPLDTSPFGQSKGAGLILNYNVDSNGTLLPGGTDGLIVATGTVGINTLTPVPTLGLNVIGKVGASAYCDVNGNNCTTSLGTSGPLPSYNDLPSGAVAGWCELPASGSGCDGGSLSTAPAYCAAGYNDNVGSWASAQFNVLVPLVLL